MRKLLHEGPAALEALSREVGGDVADLMVPLFHEVIIKDANLKFLFVNDAFASGRGIKPEDAVGRDDFAFFPARRAKQYRRDDRLAMAADGPTTHESIYRDRPGETMVYSARKYPVRDAAGNVVALVVIAESSTYRERAEKVFAHWGSVVMSSADAVMALNLDGEILAWNPGAERMYGYSFAEVEKRPVTILATADDRPQMQEVVRSVAGGQRVRDYEMRHRTKAGRTLWVDLTLSPVWDRREQVSAISAIGHDVTERVRMERELKESLERMAHANTELGHLAYAAGHEPHRPSMHRDQIEEVARAVRADPVREMDFGAEAARLNMSYSHFRRLFHEFAGHSPHDYLLLWRMRRATRLLRDPLRPIKAVALELGYDDPNQFSKLFKKKIGVSPTEYRDALERQ